jgi:hypothetical protein
MNIIRCQISCRGALHNTYRQRSNLTSAMSAAPAVTPATTMPTDLHHIAVIGHNADGERRDWRGLRNPGNGYQVLICNRNRNRRRSPYHCASRCAFACGIDVRFNLRLLRNVLNCESVSADHSSDAWV